MLRIFLLYGSASEFYPSAFFNGMDFRLATYTGGPTYAPDHLGVLRSPGSNKPACQGFRLATTVADGAVLGPELVADHSASKWLPQGSNLVSQDGTAVKITYVDSTYGATLFLRSTTGFLTAAPLLGERLLVGFKAKINMGVAKSRVFSNSTSEMFLITTSLTNAFTDYSVEFTINDVHAGYIAIDFIYLSAGEVVWITDISVKKVIPTYVSTDSSGNPIVASTPQKTVTYSTDWLSKTFAETFDKFDISDPLKAPGFLCEPVRTNKCTCRKSNPVDTSGLAASTINVTISVVSDPDILSSIYRDQCNTGKVYKAVWTGAAYIEISGAVANVNKHSSSIVAKVSNIIGSAVQFGLGNSTPKTTIVGAEYSKYLQENVTPYDSVTKLVLYKSDGTGECYFILPQLEEGAFATSHICKASDGTDPLTSLVRAATIASFPTAGKIPVNDFAIRMIVVPRASGQSGVYLFGSYVDANNYTAILVSPTEITLRKRLAGVNTDATVAITHTKDTPLDLILYASQSTGTRISARAFSASWGAFTDGAVNSTEAGKANAQIAANYRLGDLNGSQFTGNISLFDSVPIPDGITDPMLWAKTHWGVA